MKSLRIAEGFSLPLETVTQTVAILAKRRAGKSYTMRRIVEQLFKASQQIVLVDPKGDQHGIRSAANGKKPGLPIVILGGEHGDAPLEPSAGEVVARLVVEERVSVLLDVSHFRKHEVATFMTAFLENLYRMKAREIYRTPMMLVVDEADAIAPQKPQKGEERMLGAAEDIVRRGGQRGIGCILVTQRSAVLNKNVLTQAQMLIVLRTIAPQDLAAMDAWIQVHGEPDKRKTLMESLPSLPTGDAWFWSPGWPTADGIFKRVHVLPIETFDSGATPKPGVKPVEPKKAADIDLAALKRQMAATIEKAKADDPRALRVRIAELERQAKALSSVRAVIEAPPKTKTVEVPVFGKADRKDAQDAINALGKLLAQMQKLDRMWDEGIIRAIGKFEKLSGLIPLAIGMPTPGYQKPAPSRSDVSLSMDRAREVREPKYAHVPGMTAAGAKAVEDGKLSGPEQRILNAIAWIESLGQPDADQAAAASLAGYTVGGGAWNNPRGSLNTKGLVEYRTGGRIALTPAGRSMAQAPKEPLTTLELHEKVMQRLRGPERKILRALLEVYPSSISNDDLAAKAGYAIGGAFNNPKGRLRSLGLIDYPERNRVIAKSILFLE